MKHFAHLANVLLGLVMLTACAAPAFADGGDKGQVTLTFMSMGKEVESREVSDDGLVGELPDVSEPGYNLIGWFDNTGQQIFNDTLVAELAGYTITAEWSIIKYDIVYKDGTNVIQGLRPSSYKVTDETVVLPTDAPKSGYIFKGWYDNIKLEGDPIEQFDATDCEDKMFYAKFAIFQPPSVSNVVARQRWPWNGLVDVDYEVGGTTEGLKVAIAFDEQGGLNRHWVATNFLAGAEPTLNPGRNRATWDTKADGVTNAVAEVQTTVNLVGNGSEKGRDLVRRTVIVAPMDSTSDSSGVMVNGKRYVLTNDLQGVVIDFSFGSGMDFAKVGDVVGIGLDPEKVKEYFGSVESLELVPGGAVKVVDPATGNKLDGLEVNADGSVMFFVTADQVVQGGSVKVHGEDETVVIDNINFFDIVPNGRVGIVATNAVSRASFRLDTREGPFESDGTEIVAYSSLWHGTPDSSVTILVNGEPLPGAQGLAGESNYVWKAVVNGTNVLTHMTSQSAAEPETAIFVVSGLNACLYAEIGWKYLQASGTYFAQLNVTCTNGLAAGVADLRFLFADRTGDDGSLLAALWNTPGRAPSGNTAEYDGVAYRYAALDASRIVSENVAVAYGVSDLGAEQIPVGERTIELYVQRRVVPETGNEGAAKVDDFVGWLCWETGGGMKAIPVVAGRSRAAALSSLASNASLSSLPGPRLLNAALAVGVVPGDGGEPYCRFSEFSVDGDAIRGRLEVGADGTRGALGPNARVALLGGDSPEGPLARLGEVDVAADGSFALPAPEGAQFFRIAIEIEEVLK